MRTMLVLSLVVVLSGCGRLPMSREALSRLALKANMIEVKGRLGPPDEIRQPAGTLTPVARETEGIWVYKGLTINPKTGDRDPETCLWFVKGRVAEIVQSGGP